MLSRKQQLGWRKPDADEKLYLPMFRLGYQQKIHLTKHGVGKTAWNDFVELLFQQEAFIDHEKCSVQSIKDQWTARIEKFNKQMGSQSDGRQNMSGHDGELSELDKTIRDIVLEVANEKAKKDAIESDKVAVNVSESTVLMKSMATDAKSRRRKADEAFKSTSDFVESSPESIGRSTRIRDDFAEFSKSIDKLVSAVAPPDVSKAVDIDEKQIEMKILQKSAQLNLIQLL